MARWRQKYDKTTGESSFVPMDEQALAVDRAEGKTTSLTLDEYANRSDLAIHGPLEPFVSPLDGSVIGGRKAYREHCKRHNVVAAEEFTPEFYQEKAKERADFFTGNVSKEETLNRRREMHEVITRAERNGR